MLNFDIVPETRDFFRQVFKYHAVQDMDTMLETMPHYSDKRFEKEQTVFGAPEDGLGYDYSDRLVEWDYNKSKLASEVATQSGAKPRTARWYQAYLSAYCRYTVELKHIIVGVNHSNGYPYCVFGYRRITTACTTTGKGGEENHQ
jgi:hypothetical protein